jgi:hypothetical protein
VINPPNLWFASLDRSPLGHAVSLSDPRQPPCPSPVSVSPPRWRRGRRHVQCDALEALSSERHDERARAR